MMSNTIPKIALLTNCTAASNFEPLVRIEDMPVGATMNELLVHWTDAIEIASKEHPDKMRTPGELYSGISFDTVTEFAQIIGHENIFVINRGAGLVRHDEKMVPYNFSYDKDIPLSARFKVTGEKFMPAIWWTKINAALNSEEFPIAKATDAYDYIVVALPGNFIRLISKDLAQIRDLRNRLFITIPRSWKGGVPASIRDATVPYIASYTHGVDFNKFNKCHRMAMKFLSNALEGGSFEKHANAVRDAQLALNDDESVGPVSYEEMFKRHPDLLKTDSAIEAINRAKAKGLRVGSKVRFVGAWRGAHGTLHVDISKTDLAGARRTLRDVMTSMSKSDTTDEEMLEQIGVFVAAVAEEDPSMIFTSKEVSTWGRLVYPAESDRMAKKGIRSSGKVSGALRSHTAYLGLEQIMVGSSPAYRLTQE